MRVLLINPPVYKVQEPWYDEPEFGRAGLAYLAGYLRTRPGFTVAILDAKLERLDFSRTLERVRSFGPDLVGLTAFTNEIKPAADVAARIKQWSAKVVTVIGGVHQTALPRETLEEFPSFDYGVNGEGELTFAELCGTLHSGGDVSQVQGVSYRQGPEVRVTPPRERELELDAIPFPAWDLLPQAGTYWVQTARGCPFACKFCMNPNGKFNRRRSVQNVIDELKLIVEKHAPEKIWFGDDIFTVDVPRTKDLLRAMIREGLHQRFRWAAVTHVRFVDDELFQLMHETRTFLVGFGIETGDEETLRGIGKGTTIDMILKAREGARRANVPITTYFIMGQINETPASLKKTVDLAVRLNPDFPVFGIMVPYPGTEVARLAARGEGGYRLLSTDWDEYNKQIGGALEFAGLSRTQIELLQLWAYVKVFLWNWRLWDVVKFAWTYRVAGWSVIKKLASRFLGRAPAPEPARQQSLKVVSPSSIAHASEAWQSWQVQELVRAKDRLRVSR